MKTIDNRSVWSATLQYQGGNAQSNGTSSGPKVGTDDGISNRALNILIILFMLLTVGMSLASANDDVKSRILLRQSMLEVERTDYEAALPMLMELFAKDATNANVNHMIGICHLYGTGNFHHAAFYLSMAATSVSNDYQVWDLEERSSPVQTLYLLATAYEQAGRDDLAAETFTKYLTHVGQEGGKKISPRMRGIIERQLAQCVQRATAIETDAVAIDK
jgi:tetratricopeptide (TPR) repeat protein